MEAFLREWRQDALNKHQYESAIFIGDKLLALTNDDKDAFWLAQVHFSTGNYTRALGFLSRQELIARNPACKYLAAHCYVKQARFDEALTVLGDKDPVHLISSSDRVRRKLQHLDTRNVNGKHGKLPQRAERSDRSEERADEDLGNIRFEAAMCHLRGLCYAKQNAFDRAKTCYKDAVRIDVQCFEAFDQLMKNQLMSPSEEWQFLESLDFDSIITTDGTSNQEAADFTKMLYTTRLSKYTRPDDFLGAVETLSNHYNLAFNASILLAKADLLMTTYRFREALTLTSAILEADPYNLAAIPVHLACLYELRETNALFLLSHDLADTHPEEPATWLAVGTYYLAIDSIPQARSYFSKASLMDPHFGPAWIGFAHTFAAEGEHDQAISAYSTAARLFQGTHLPQLFLGMQNLQLHNLGLAREYLNTAYSMCQTDPLLLNDLGVVYYHDGHLEEAIRSFKYALTLVNDVGADPREWLETRTNLAHSYLRNGQFDEALAELDEVLRRGSQDAATFTTKGLVFLELGDFRGAMSVLHEALAVSPQAPLATELLNRALEGVSQSQSLAGNDDGKRWRAEEMKVTIAQKAATANGRRRTARRNRVTEVDDSMNWSVEDGTEHG